MNEKILRILYEYCNKYADEKYILDICDIIIKYYNLDNYINDIKVINEKHGKLNSYIFSHKNLVFNLAKIHDSSVKTLIKDNYCLFYNLQSLLVVFHEMEHVMQEKIKVVGNNLVLKKILLLNDPTKYLKTDNNDQSLVKLLLCLYRYYQYKIYYNFHYYQAPHERIAIVKSCINVQSIIKYFNFDKNFLDDYDDYLNQILYHILIRGYRLDGNITNSPTLDYLKKLKYIDNPKELENVKSMCNLDIDYNERLLLGLYLTSNEYYGIFNKKNGENKILFLKK